KTEVKLGQAYQADKDVTNAIGAYGKALSLKPGDSDILDTLQSGWEEALRANPTAPENHIGLGQAYQYKGDLVQAKAEYKQALMFDRKNSTAQKLLDNLSAMHKGTDSEKRSEPIAPSSEAASAVPMVAPKANT